MDFQERTSPNLEIKRSGSKLWNNLSEILSMWTMSKLRSFVRKKCFSCPWIDLSFLWPLPCFLQKNKKTVSYNTTSGYRVPNDVKTKSIVELFSVQCLQFCLFANLLTWKFASSLLKIRSLRSLWKIKYIRIAKSFHLPYLFCVIPASIIYERSLSSYFKNVFTNSRPKRNDI